MATRDDDLKSAQARFLDRHAPGAKVRRISWSLGETQAIELGAGPPLLLLHGGGDAAFEWVPILGALSTTYRAIAIDRPGHGLADPFSYRGVNLHEHIRSFVGDMLDALELPRADFLTNSIGGYWAAVYALEHPERVRRLVIAGAPPGVVRDAPLPLRAMGTPLVGPAIGRMVLGNPSREGSRKFWSQLLVAHPERLPDELLDCDAAHMRRNAKWIRELLYLLVGPGGVRPDLVLGQRWAELSVPTLALFGEHDAFLTTGMRRAWEGLASSNEQIRMERIPGAGHLPWIDEPGGTVRAVRGFLG